MTLCISRSGRAGPASILIAALALLAGATQARAQEAAFTLPVERFRPAIDDKGLGTTESGAVPTAFGFQTGLILNYALNPLVIRDGDGDVIAPIIAHRLAGDALFTLGLFDYASIGLDLPITFLQVGGTVPDNLIDAVGAGNGLAGIGLGDLKLVPKVRVLREDKHFISLAFTPAVTLPTAGGVKFGTDGATYDYGGSYLGEGPGAFAFIPEVAVSTNVKGVRVAANFAYRLRQPVKFLGALDINPEFVYRGGVGYDFSSLAPKMNPLLLFAELYGATPDFGLVRDPNASESEQRVQDVEARLTNPLEWAAGVRYHVLAGLSLEGGFGAGMLPGYGSPDVRVFAGVRYGVEDRDKDDDGIEDDSDKCPEDPEDKDGWQDADGCPDRDNDGDGLPDSADKCPDQAEDPDGFKDEDGCPEIDNDQDGIHDDEDKCPLVFGEKAYAGCPAPDRDKDTVPDVKDLCPDVPGKVELGGCPDRDNDGIEDEKDKCPDEAGPASAGGCPDKDGDGIRDTEDRCPEQPGPVEFKGCPDTDKDGIADPDDKCPTEPETINGFEDDDGCPDKGKILVIVTKEKVELNETIYFDTGKATIKKVSFGLLDQVTLVLKAHTEIKKMLVEGHTDDQGPDDFNMDLSKKRAASVMQYLIEHGVSAERLSSEGYGETRPIEVNKTRKGREKNRRVEIKIIEQE